MDEKILLELSKINIDTDSGEQLFRNLSLRLPYGRSAILLGGAGSGKTVLVQTLVGGRFPVTGTIELFGELVRRGRGRVIRRVRRKIGGVGGIFELIPNLTIYENIEFPLMIDNVPKQQRRERVMKSLADFSLLKYANMYPRSLTRVQNIIVQIARASIGNQPLMIIDEPFAGLDQTTYTRVMEHLEHIALSGRSLLVLTSTPPPQFLPNCDLYHFRDGELQA